MAVEQEITSDVSAVAEPEIESDESPEQEPEKEPEENTEWEGEFGETGCPIWMDYYGNLGCGRKLHVAPDGVDEKLVCLMHSKDPNKQSGPLFDAFWMEFERILGVAEENEAHFEGFVFPEFDFSGRTFQAICLLSDATFTTDADFYEAIFEKNVDFSDATFENNAEFGSATFTQEAGFHNATFGQEAHFGIATFMQDANFSHAIFTKDADFSFATFTQAAHFVGTEFHGTADCHCSRFLDRAEFLYTEFDPRIEGRPSAMFDGANFSKPSEIVFDDVDLSRALFSNCDVSQVWFTSSVQWGKRKGSRGLAVFDETIPLGQEFAEGLQRDGQRDYCAYCAAEQIYHQLKKNYDSRLDYRTANEFHFSEMEMTRLAGPTAGRLLWLRRWWYPRLSLVALYRYASDYGNSYRKPLAWMLFFILFAFPVLFPLRGVGLKRQGATQAETYASKWNVQKSYGENLWAEVRLAGKGAITSVDAATFQKSAEYTPAYPWGRVLAIFETLLTSSLFALFLLAIRRQFRR
jgi:uncharacterized protein YjbI with pentapeptide repeats